MPIHLRFARFCFNQILLLTYQSDLYGQKSVYLRNGLYRIISFKKVNIVSKILLLIVVVVVVVVQFRQEYPNNQVGYRNETLYRDWNP